MLGQPEANVLALSRPIEVTDVNSGRTCKSPILVSKDCPISLLERGVMKKLGICIVPTDTGMKAILKEEQEDSFVMHGKGTPHYYWTLDLGPAPMARELLRKVRQQG